MTNVFFPKDTIKAIRKQFRKMNIIIVLYTRK